MKNFSEETKLKMSESAKRRCSDPKWLELQHNRGTKLPLCVVKEMYNSGHTQTEIAEFLGVSQKVVWKFMKNNNITARVAAKRDQYGSNNDYWKGGRRINDQGYVEIYMPSYEHKRANGYVREHIFVAEQMIGRKLIFYGVGDGRNEIVHHIDGNKQNNSPSNLLILTAKEHIMLHFSRNKEQIDSVLLNRIRELESELKSMAVTKERFK